MEKKTIKQTINLVENNVSSIYTKQDVLNLLDNLTTEVGLIEFRKILVNNFESMLEKTDVFNSETVVDHSSAEFEIHNCNEIVLTQVDVNTDDVIREVLGCLGDVFDESLKEALETTISE